MRTYKILKIHSMEIIEKDKKNDIKNISIKITKDDYAAEVENELRKIRKQTKMPGFRPGKVPMSLIKKQYEKAVKIDKINHIVQKALEDYSRQNDIQLIGSFLPAEEQKKYNFDEEEFEFSFDWAPVPEAKIKMSALKKIPYYKFIYTDKDVEEEIEHYRKNYAQWKDVEEVSEETSEILSLKIPGMEKDAVVYPKNFDTKAYAEITKGKKKGDPVKLTVKQLTEWFELLPEIASHIENQKIRKNTKVEGKINTVLKRELPELNADFFKKIFPDKEIKDLKTFKKTLKEQMNKDGVSQGRNVYVNRLWEEIYKAIDVKLPDEFMKRWLKYNSEKEIDDKEIEEQYNALKERYKFEIARTQKLKEKGIEISDEDILKAATDMIIRYYLSNPQAFGALPEPEQLYQMAIESLKDKRFAEEAYETAANEKFFEILTEEIGTEPREITPEEYAKENEKNIKKS